MPISLDYRYYVKAKSRVPKSVSLLDEIYVKTINYTKRLVSCPQDGKNNETVVGKRIVIAGTGEARGSRPEHIFFAVFNTVLNVTEYLHEESSKVRELSRGLEVDAINEQRKRDAHRLVILLSDRYSNDPIDPSCLRPGGATSSSWRVAVRAYTFSRRVSA